MIPPICRAALATEGKKARVALGTALAEDALIDEALPEIKRYRSP